MTTVSETSATRRNGIIAGLHQLADLLAANPALEAPWDGATSITPLNVHGRSREDVAIWASELTAATERTDDEYHHLTGRVAGLTVHVMTPLERLGRSVVREVEIFEVDPFLTVEPESVSA